MFIRIHGVLAPLITLIILLCSVHSISGQTGVPAGCPLSVAVGAVEESELPGHLLFENIYFPVDRLTWARLPYLNMGEYFTEPRRPATQHNYWELAYIYTSCWQPDPWVPIIEVVVVRRTGYISVRSDGTGGGGGESQPDNLPWYEYIDGQRFVCWNESTPDGSRVTHCTADPE